jgi:general secretion pathway protein H
MTVRAEPLRNEAGFTLIEMIVVLVVIGLVIGLFIGRGPMRSPHLEARAAAEQLAQSLRLARARAIASDQPVKLVLDASRHRFAIDGGAIQNLPGYLALTMTTVAGETTGRGIGAIAFAPDGSSSGGRIELAGAGGKLQVGVDWLTGRVSIADAH